MNMSPPHPRSAEIAAKIRRFAETYHADAKLRARADEDPHAALIENGFTLPPELDVRLAVDSDDVRHVVMPPDPNAALNDEALSGIYGGNSIDCVASAPQMRGSI